MGSGNDRIVGAVNKASGKVKEAVGKAIGNGRLEGEGHSQQAKGKAQTAKGKSKDAVKSGIDKA